jgi:hypothetical protein
MIAGFNFSVCQNPPRRLLKPLRMLRSRAGPHRHVDGQHQRAAAGIGGAPHQILRDFRVARRIELVPHVVGRDLRGGLDRGVAAARHDVGDVRLGRRPGQHQIGVTAEQPGGAGRRDAERARIGAAEDGLALVAARDVDEIARQQVVALEGGPVALEAALVLDAALNEVEGDFRQPPPRQLVQVFDVDGVGDPHDPRPSRSGNLPGRIAYRRMLRQATGIDPDFGRTLPGVHQGRIGSRAEFLDDIEDRAAPGHPVTPHPIEIGDQRLDLVGRRRRLCLFDRVEFVERDMHAGIAAAPAAPGAARAERLARPRQVVGLVPMVEPRPLRLGHLGPHREIGFRHLVRRRRSNRRG